jgi:hypothetical protein
LSESLHALGRDPAIFVHFVSFRSYDSFVSLYLSGTLK